MPTYEYECKSCGHNFEVFQSMSDPSLKDCPECGREIRRLIFGGTGVIFKGSGFYVTDKSKTPGKASDKTKSSQPDSSQSTAAQPAAGEAAKTDSAQQASAQQTAGSKQDSKTSGEKAKPESKASLRSQSA